MSMLIGKVEPGDVIGRCRIIRELGRGGVGTVYLAKHQTLQIEVALKVLSPAMSIEQPALAERFIREAQLAARIRHPNVIAVMDAAHDEPTGLYYIVLEYVGGGALAWHLRNGPLPEAKAVGIMIGIAQALIVAEENSIVHRDIKPENIMLDGRGTAKLADLGLAKHEIDSRTSLTLGGSYMGTPAYMSPEQARDAKAADTRDDIYSLGATLYECLTGEPPFSGDTPYNIMSELLTKPSPRICDRQPEVSRSLDVICRKMMAKTRALRYGDAHALVRDLQHFQLHGEKGFARLEAASFARDSHLERINALQHGVHTPSNTMDEGHPPPTPIVRTPHRPGVPSTAEAEGAFRAAIWLVALVVLATGLLLFAGRSAPITPAPAVVTVPAPEKKPALASKPKPHPPQTGLATNALATAELVPPRAFPVEPLALDTNGVPVTPVAVPTSPADDTPPITLADITNASFGIEPPPAAVPLPASPTAFQARDIAEAGLSQSLIMPTGHANVLKIIGRRTPGSPAPTSWTFYFYDTSATGNATYRTVRGGRIVRDGEAITVAVFPWHVDDVLGEDKLKIESDAALGIAQALVPHAPISSSAVELWRPKNSEPVWHLTLWTRGRDGGEEQLGTVQIVAENGYVLTKNLNPPAS
jgi:serine/threonine protein kinase